MARKTREIYDTNRTVSRQPRKHSGWCRGCDSAKVPDGAKCKVCGRKSKPIRDKK